MTPRFQLPESARLHVLQMPDGTRVRTLTLAHAAPIANLLLLTGRADFLEKWADAIGELHAMGFAIASCDWRGQGGSDRAVSNGAGHIDSFDTWVNDLDQIAAWAAGALAPGRWVLLAHSMGGQILSRWLAAGRLAQGPTRGPLAALTAGVVLSAPLFGIHGNRLVNRAVELVARLQVRRGHGTDFAIGQQPYGESQRTHQRMQVLTSSRERFDDEGRWLIQRPELAVGGVSWGWLDAFARSRRQLARDGLGQVDLPLLALLAGDEAVVDNGATRGALGRLPQARMRVIDGARHELLRESDRLRAEARGYIAGFVQELVRDG